MTLGTKGTEALKWKLLETAGLGTCHGTNEHSFASLEIGVQICKASAVWFVSEMFQTFGDEIKSPFRGAIELFIVACANDTMSETHTSLKQKHGQRSTTGSSQIRL